MFLTTRMSEMRRSERGSTMVAVLGVMAVTSIIGVTVVASSISGVAVTTTTRAAVQSVAAAEAGIDVAVVGLQTAGSCAAVSGVYKSTVTPAYSVAVQYDEGTGWINGCPPKTATKVRLVSTGSAKSTATIASSNGNTKKVEAIYNYIPDYVQVPFIDAAIYAYKMTGVLKSFELNSADQTLAADVQIKSGNATCSNNATIAGKVIVADGYASFSNCKVTGTVHVSKFVTATNGSTLLGDVIAAGQGLGAAVDNVTIASGTQVSGNIFAGGNVSVLSSSASTVDGNVTVAGVPTNTALLAAGSTIKGNVISSGTAVILGTLLGTKSTAVTGLQAPPVPQIPNWTDLPYTSGTFASSTWKAQGYQEVLWSGNCSVGGGHAFWASLANLTTPTVVNALGCTTGITTLSNLDTITIKTNITFIAKAFDFTKLYINTNNTTLRSVRFIVPDNTADAAPTCVGPAPLGEINLSNESNIQPTVGMFVYSPCRVYSDRDGFRGQIFGGEVEFGQQAKLVYVPVGIPGVDLNASLPPILVLDSAHLGNRVSVRELAKNGS